MVNNRRYLILLASFALSMAGLLGVLSPAWAPARALDLPATPCPPPDGRALPVSLRNACAGEGVQEFWAPPAAPIPSGSQDNFGYKVYDDQGFSWIDIITGTVAITKALPGSEPVVAGPIALGFPFKFYENQYSQVYISDNGLLSFDDINEQELSLNQNIPDDYEFPQNIIAPFWDSLVVDQVGDGSSVYYATGTHAVKGKYFAVEWHQVESLVSVGDLTFEVILYEDGDIVFLYDELFGPTDDATVGIEDSYGADGLQYLYNSEGLTVTKQILFERPDPSWRVKVSPDYQGAFNIGGRSSFKVFVRNLGDFSPNDSFTFIASLSDPTWSAALLDQDGQPATSTGTLAEGDVFTLTVELTAPPEAEAGDQVTVTLTATSAGNPLKSSSAEIVSAVPAPFGLIYREGQPLRTEFVGPTVNYDSVVDKFYSAETFALSDVLDGVYVSVWENQSNGISYFLLNGAGILYFDEPHELVSGTEYDQRQGPVVMAAPDGTIGVAWLRGEQIFSGTAVLYRDNIYFARLDKDGEKVGGEINVTGIHTETEDPITFDSLRILATDDNYFHLSWVQNDPGGATDIGHAVYSDTGDIPEKMAEIFSIGTPSDNINYSSPALVEYGTNVLLLYFSKDSTNPLNPVEKVVYGKFGTDGGPVLGQTDLYPNTKGTGIDAIQLNDGNLALAWTIPSDGKVAVAVIDNLASPATPLEFSNPDKRSASTVSITGSQAGQAILTWMDGSHKTRMYYALVDYDHGVVTWPMAFKYVDVKLLGSELETNLGWGNASYIPMFRVSLPLVSR